MHAENRRETLKHSSIFSLFTSLSRLLGLIRDMLKAYAFGTGPLSVAFDIAFRLNNMLRNLVAEGALSQAFVPLYNKYAATGREKADEAAGVVIVFVSIAMGFITVAIIFALPYLLPILLSGDKLPEEQLQLTISLSQLLFPYLLMMSVASLYMGIQYSHKIFWAASFGPALLNIVIIVIFGSYATYARISGRLLQREAIYVFSIASLFAAAVQVVFQIYTVHRRGLAPRYTLSFRHSALKALGSLMLPATFAAAMQELGQLIDVYLATSLVDRVPEAISALTYSHRLIQLPIGVFGVAVATVSLPQLAKLFQQSRFEEYSNSLGYSIRLNFFFLLPAIAGLVIFARPIVALIFERGAFDARSTDVTALALQCYAPGILAYSLQKVLSASFYARMNTRTPAIITAISLSLNFALSLWLMQDLLHGGLALGSALAAWAGVAIYFFLALRSQTLSTGKLFASLWRIILINAILLVLLLVLRSYCFPARPTLQLAISIPIAIATYILLARTTQLEETNALFELLAKIKNKLRRT